MVQAALRDGALAGRPLDDVWAEILASTQHDRPRIGRLSGLAGQQHPGRPRQLSGRR